MLTGFSWTFNRCEKDHTFLLDFLRQWIDLLNIIRVFWIYLDYESIYALEVWIEVAAFWVAIENDLFAVDYNFPFRLALRYALHKMRVVCYTSNTCFLQSNGPNSCPFYTYVKLFILLTKRPSFLALTPIIVAIKVGSRRCNRWIIRPS